MSSESVTLVEWEGRGGSRSRDAGRAWQGARSKVNERGIACGLSHLEDGPVQPQQHTTGLIVDTVLAVGQRTEEKFVAKASPVAKHKNV